MIQAAIFQKRLLTSKTAKALYPHQPDLCVAVTGTNGKTSVASYVRQLWQALDLKAVSLGTVGIEPTKSFTQELPVVPSLTTPGAMDLHQILNDLQKKGCQACVLEASSHGLDQCRLHQVALKAAGFTNLSQDHLDYHEDIEAYFKAKEKLFTEIDDLSKPAVINRDCAYGQRLIKSLKNVVTYSLLDPSATLFAKNVRCTEYGMTFEFFYNQESKGDFSVPIFGDFHISNILCALGLVLSSMSVSIDDLLAHLKQLKSVSGRLEEVKNNFGYKIFVDYAHTPDALQKALMTLKNLEPKKLVVVFGCGGDRDKTKRPLMGKIAHTLADKVIITDDNPRTEDADIIRQEVASLLSFGSFVDCGDRKKAIELAINSLSHGDTLLIAGKGHEQGQTIGTVVYPFHDVSVVQEILSQKEGL